MIDCPQLKDDDKLFASWDRVLQAIATAQDVHEVLDHTYIPITQQQQEEQEQLFKAKNAFMYSVFVSTLDTGTQPRAESMSESIRRTWMHRACMRH